MIVVRCVVVAHEYFEEDGSDILHGCLIGGCG